MRAVRAIIHHSECEGVQDQGVYTNPNSGGPWHEPRAGHPHHRTACGNRRRVARSPRIGSRTTSCGNRSPAFGHRTRDPCGAVGLVGLHVRSPFHPPRPHPSAAVVPVSARPARLQQTPPQHRSAPPTHYCLPRPVLPLVHRRRPASSTPPPWNAGAAAIWHNETTYQPRPARSLTAYDHQPLGTNRAVLVTT